MALSTAKNNALIFVPKTGGHNDQRDDWQQGDDRQGSIY